MLLMMRVCASLINLLKNNIMEEKKKNVWTVVLTIVRYAVAVALGYLTGDSTVINNLI